MAGEKRQFTYPEWEYSIEALKRHSGRRPWLSRFRMEYFFLLRFNNSPGKKFRQLLEGKLMYLALLKRLLQKQSRDVRTLGSDTELIVLLSDNNAYLNNLLPIIHALQLSPAKLLLLCPANHYTKVQGLLKRELQDRLVAFESVAVAPTLSGRIGRSLSSGIKAWFSAWQLAFLPFRSGFFFSARFARYALTQHLYGEILDTYFRQNKPRLFAAGDQWLWESLYFTTAAKHDIESYTMQHGAVGDYTFPIFAKKFLLWGELDKQKMMQETGATEAECLVLGSPYFDEIYKKISTYRSHSSQYGRPCIVFLSQPFLSNKLMEAAHYHAVKKMFYALAPLAEKLGKQLYIQLHPRDDAAYYTDRPPAVQISQLPLMEILNDSCLAITVDSTAIFEAVMMEIPTLQLSVPNESAYVDFSFSGATVWLQSAEMLLAATQDLLDNEEKYHFRIRSANEALTHYYHELGHSIAGYRKLLEQGLD